MTVRSLLLALTGSLLLSCAPAPKAVEAPPSFLIVDIDTLRADRLGIYGNHRPTSPNIDAWSASATVFEWAFSQAPSTSPSQASILTGLYPRTHGRIDGSRAVRQDATTLAEILENAGYRTAAFVDGGFMAAGFGLEQGFETYDNSRGAGLESIGPKSVAWLTSGDARPFLLLVHAYDVHSPYSPKPEYRELVAGDCAPSTPGFEPTVEVLEEIRLSRWKGEPRTLSDGDLAYALALYDSEIRQMDDWFGAYLEQLRGLGLLDDTVVVLISDHGEEFQEHGSVLHEKLYSTVTHVPLVLSFPGQSQGTRIPDVVQTIDLAPTIVRLAGLPVPPGFQGADLLLQGRKRRMAYGESPLFGEQRFLAKGTWKAVAYLNSGKVELYRYREDPLEQADLSGSHAAIAAQFRVAIDDLESQMRSHRALFTPEANVDSATIEQLRSLGYLN